MNDHRPEYWKNFGRLITAADTGAVLTCIGWIFFWMDHIPEHLFHTHFLVLAVFITSFAFGLYGAVVLVTSRGRYGTRLDRIFIACQILYTLAGSASGLAANAIWPPG